jgi:uncharacterized membrane protein
MKTRARLMGHAIHPMLVVFPLGLFTTAVVFDLVELITGNVTFAQVGFWDITAGLIGAVLAALAGLADWISVPSRTRAKAVGMRHGLLNVAVTVIFLIAWAMRISRDGHVAGGGIFILELIGLIIAVAAAWLGGELVQRLAVSIDEHAEPDAPSSLRHAPVDSPRVSGTARR